MFSAGPVAHDEPMGRIYEELDAGLIAFIEEQKLFFVASAPLAGNGHVNLSPKGLDTLRVLGPKRVAYLDLTGSGIETTSHLDENGRITFLFCAFTGAPKILRLYGTGRAHRAGTPEFEALRPSFPDFGAVRSVIDVTIERIADSCGYGVPFYEYVGDRDTLPRWAEVKSQEEIAAYQVSRNTLSIDGLPGLFGEAGSGGREAATDV